MERWEYLKPGGLCFAVDEQVFRPGTDSFLLASMPRLKAGLRVCDLGCGAGLLGLLLLQRQQNLHVTGVDIQPRAVELGRESALRNGLTERMTFHLGDLREIRTILPAGQTDLVVCNPPYYPTGSGAVSEDAHRSTARTELTCTLEDICRAAAWLLRWDGRFCLVHKPERLTDVLCALRAHDLEPKRLRFVCKNSGAAPSLFLLEACRGGKSGMQIEAPLLLQNADGSPAAELNAIYFRNQEDTP